jgi:hypothetical protein
MSKVSSRKGRVAVLLSALATVGAIVAFMAASASADGRTINGAFCIDTSTHAFCMQASFGDQQAEGYCAGVAVPGPNQTCTPNQNTGGIISLRPGTYWITVVDNNARHDFSLRSCPGSTSVCGDTPGSDELPITTDSAGSPADPVTVTVKVHLDHGTYRLFCGNDGPPNHEALGMYVDFVVGGVGQVG